MTYIHDYSLIPDSKTERGLRSLHYDHAWALNEAKAYIGEFERADYEDFSGIGRVKFMLRRNVFESGNKETRNVVERVGHRLKELPCQDSEVKRVLNKIRELWVLLNLAGNYYKSVGQHRPKHKEIFYKELTKFKKCITLEDYLKLKKSKES